MAKVFPRLIFSILILIIFFRIRNLSKTYFGYFYSSFQFNFFALEIFPRYIRNFLILHLPKRLTLFSKVNSTNFNALNWFPTTRNCIHYKIVFNIVFSTKQITLRKRRKSRDILIIEKLENILLGANALILTL